MPEFGYSQWASRKVSVSPVATEAPRSRAVIRPFRSRWRTTRTMCSCFRYSSSSSFSRSVRNRKVKTICFCAFNLQSIIVKPSLSKILRHASFHREGNNRMHCNKLSTKCIQMENEMREMSVIKM